MMVPSSMFQSTSASISCSSPAALSAPIQPRRSPKATGCRSMVILVSFALAPELLCGDQAGSGLPASPAKTAPPQG